MPVHKIPGGYQYGNTGKKYYGKDAKRKAQKQALAIRLSGYDETVGSNSNFKNLAEIKKEPRKIRKRKTLTHESNLASIGKLFVDNFFKKG